MPLFSFKCQECQHEFEKLTSHSLVPECPNCKTGKVEKLLSAPSGFVFKGKGAYATDYKNK